MYLFIYFSNILSDYFAQIITPANPEGLVGLTLGSDTRFAHRQGFFAQTDMFSISN